MSKKTEDKQTIREIYRNSSERISLTLKLFGSPKQEGVPPPFSEKDFDTISNLINSVVSAQSFEEQNDYRAAILDIGSWVFKAFNKEYLDKNAALYPSPYYVIKRGLDALHMLLHRDLRRRQLSPTESQVFYEFKHICKQLPDPRGKALTQAEADALVNKALG